MALSLKMLGIRWFLFLLCSAPVVFVTCDRDEVATQAESVIFDDLVSLVEDEVIRYLDEEDEDDNDEAPVRDAGRHERICPKSEEYSTCGCQISCDTLGTSCPPTSCSPGCFCKTGKVRSHHGHCISQKHCLGMNTS